MWPMRDAGGKLGGSGVAQVRRLLGLKLSAEQEKELMKGLVTLAVKKKEDALKTAAAKWAFGSMGHTRRYRIEGGKGKPTVWHEEVVPLSRLSANRQSEQIVHLYDGPVKKERLRKEAEERQRLEPPYKGPTLKQAEIRSQIDRLTKAGVAAATFAVAKTRGEAGGPLTPAAQKAFKSRLAKRLRVDEAQVTLGVSERGPMILVTATLHPSAASGAPSLHSLAERLAAHDAALHRELMRAYEHVHLLVGRNDVQETQRLLDARNRRASSLALQRRWRTKSRSQPHLGIATTRLQLGCDETVQCQKAVGR